jgi:vesicle-fusing ATPase
MLKSVKPLPDSNTTFDNCIILSTKSTNNPSYVSINDFIIKTIESDLIEIEQIGMNMILRKICKLAFDDKVSIKEYDHTKTTFQKNIKFFLKKFKDTAEIIKFDEKELLEQTLNILIGHIPTVGMCYCIKLNGVTFFVVIMEVSNIGIVTKETTLEFNQIDDNIIINSSKGLNLFKKSINIEELGIGGLNDEFLTIFRKVFSSRLLPKNIREELGITHVKGILLYGPPGCGKTALARQLGKILNCTEPKIVNGPSLLSKYVGESEENTRKLFADAIEDQKKGKDNLHLIICDEFDAIGKKRGLKTDTGVSDQIVNTFLTMIDGVNSLNNILLICMTNRKDMIDEALMRSGRLEVQIEIKLPTKEGRIEILKIHTNQMKLSKRFDSNIDLNEIAEVTQNYSGAEIEGLIRNAVSFAISREINMDTIGSDKKQKEIVNPIVLKEDFDRALLEIKPNLGTTNEIYSSIIQRIKIDENFRKVIKNIEDAKIKIQKGKVTSVLIIGMPKTCKTYLSCYTANMFKMNQIQMITPMNLSFSKMDILESIDKCKVTSNSCLIFDDLEGLFSWNNINQSYDNGIYQLVRNSCKVFIKENQELLIIANCNYGNMTSNMDFDKLFDYVINLS